jgi:hypothetical protein
MGRLTPSEVCKKGSKMPKFMKYGFTGRTKKINGEIEVFQIRRLSDGRLGGWIESEDNLSQEGTCWISEGVVVLDFAAVTGDAQVLGQIQLLGHARVEGSATIDGSAAIGGSSVVIGEFDIEDRLQPVVEAPVVDKPNLCDGCVRGLKLSAGVHILPNGRPDQLCSDI